MYPFPNISPHQSPLSSILPNPLPLPLLLIYRPHNIYRSIQITKFLIVKSTPFICYRVPIRLRCPPQHPILKHPQPISLPQYNRPSFKPIQNTGNIIFLFILFFIICSKLEEKDSTPYDSKKVRSAINFLMNVIFTC